MPFPAYVPTRQVTLGGAQALETSDPLVIKATIKASRSLVWDATGYRFESARVDVTSTEAGTELTMLVPRTDVAGWRDSRLNALIDISAPGAYTHAYTLEVQFYLAGALVSSDVIGPFTVPTGDGALDLDKVIPVGSTSGQAVSIPDSWSAAVSAAQQAANDAAQDAAAAVAAVGGKQDAATLDEDVAQEFDAPDSALRGAVSAQIEEGAEPIAEAAVTARKRQAPRIADGIFGAVDEALHDGRATTIQVESDSTGNSVGEWVYMLTQWLATRWPSAHIRYKVADQAPPYTYGAWEVMQVGADGERHAYFPPPISGTPAARTFYTPAGAFASATGDQDVRCRVALDAWTGAGSTQALVSRWGSSAGSRSIRLEVQGNGLPRFAWSPDGTNELTVPATTPAGYTAGQERWLRGTLDVDNGEGGYTAAIWGSSDGATWTKLGENKTTTGGSTTVFNPSAQDYEVGGFGFSGFLIRGGKVYEAQIRDGIGGRILNPQPIESWIPRNASGSYLANEFRGGPTLYVVNGAVSGADSQAFLANDTYFFNLVPPTPGSLIFVSCIHNENNLVEGQFVSTRDAWQAKLDARSPGNQTVWLTQNPKFAPSASATIDSVQKHARRRQLLMAWAARKGVAVIDTWRAYLDDGRPISDMVQSDGVHPTQGDGSAGQGDGATGSAVWFRAVRDAWNAASPY